MLNWASPIAPGHPLKRKFPQAYPDQVLPESAVPGITKVLYEFHDAIADLQRRFLRVIAEGIGCYETFFDDSFSDCGGGNVKAFAQLLLEKMKQRCKECI